jgi:hypothetical protein
MKIGDRVFFFVKHGIGEFGRVVKINDDSRLIIMGDNSGYYSALPTEVVIIGTRTEDPS